MAEAQAAATAYSKDERIQIYKENFGKSYKALSKIVKASYQTVCTDMRDWRTSGGFMDFVYERFGPLHENITSLDPLTAYKVLARFIEKDMSLKVQTDITIDVSEKLHKVLGDMFGVEREK